MRRLLLLTPPLRTRFAKYWCAPNGKKWCAYFTLHTTWRRLRSSVHELFFESRTHCYRRVARWNDSGNFKRRTKRTFTWRSFHPDIERAKSIKGYRILAVVRRHLYEMRRTLDRVGDMVYWPVLDVLVWGLFTVYLSDQFSSGLTIINVLLGAIIL